MEKLSMRKTREILRLKFDLDLSDRQISKSTQVARSTISDYIRRFAVAGLSWPLPVDMTEVDINARLFPPKLLSVDVLRASPNWDEVNREMRRKGVTLFLLWQEYKANQPEGFNYSWFCESYRKWAGKLDAVMRQEHPAGEKCFVDYCGKTMPVTDRYTGANLRRRDGGVQLHLCRSDF
jgi:transposase